MTNEIKKVPVLRFPGFRDEWEEKRLGDIGEFKNGINKGKNDFGYGVPFINLNDVFSNSIILKENLSLVNANNKEINDYNLIKGDTLFIRSSVKPSGVGLTKVIMNNDFSNTVYSGFLIRYRIFDNDYFNDKFKIYLFKSNNFRKQILRQSTSSANTNINQEELKIIKTKIPSIKEQQKIGDFFSKLDRQIELEEQKLEKLEEQKKGYMQKIFSQELRFKDANGNDYPEWKASKIENQLKERNERSGEGQMLSVTINSGIVKFNELDRKDNSSKDKSNYKVVRKDDIAYNSMRMWQGASGKSDYDGIVSPAYTVIYPTQSTSSAFIEYKFKIYRMIHTFKINSQGLTSDTWNLKYKQLKNINIDMPILEEQEKIGSFFKKIDKLINKQKEKIEILQKNKKGFLQKMFV